MREEKIIEYVLALQSYFRMLKDYQHFRRYKRAILRLQGFCKSWEIRRAYVEVRTAARLIQRYGRTYLAFKKFQDMRDSDDPALTKEKRREILQKILHPERFGKTKIGLSGKRRRIKLVVSAVKGDVVDDGDEEFMEMPKFQITHEGWLNVRVGRFNKSNKVYVSLKQGTLTLFEDHESLEAILSYNLAACNLEGYHGVGAGGDDEQGAVKKKPPKALTSLTVNRKEKLYTHKVRNFREMGRRIKGPLWGNDVMIFDVEAGQSDVLETWAEKLDESIHEARLVDSYKMQVNLDGDEDDKPVNQKVASIIKEGYMRKKKPGNNVLQDMKRSWERRYMVLYNDGKLRYYDARAKKDEKGSLDLRFFALQEVEEEMEIDDEEEGEERQALKVANQFFKIEKGKQFGLYSGKHVFYLASPEKAVADEWIQCLQTTLAILYQKSPIFSQEFLRISLMDGTFTTMPMDEMTRTRDVIRFMCKKHSLNNESEWGLIEQVRNLPAISPLPPLRLAWASLTFSHLLSPSLTFSHLLSPLFSPSLTFDVVPSRSGSGSSSR